MCVVASVMSNSLRLYWTIVCQAPLSMGFSRQEYWSGLPFTPPGDLSNPGKEPTSVMSTHIGRWVLYLGNWYGDQKGSTFDERRGKRSTYSGMVLILGNLIMARSILYSPWNSPGQNTGVGSLSLLQGIFPTQESNPGLLNCRQILY